MDETSEPNQTWLGWTWQRPGARNIIMATSKIYSTELDQVPLQPNLAILNATKSLSQTYKDVFLL